MKEVQLEEGCNSACSVGGTVPGVGGGGGVWQGMVGEHGYLR